MMTRASLALLTIGIIGAAPAEPLFVDAASAWQPVLDCGSWLPWQEQIEVMHCTPEVSP